ncbi:hypothetical protein [Bacillus sp. V3-13]|uniref:hypothetical protein n=1 Tax=Bacillus sp. V3-13 TaxID=2053728 RepID=UPI0015E076F7|nr:hypothetical protein [Bacillus sp. V3-13]
MNEDHREFQKHQRKSVYLRGASGPHRESDHDYNSRNNTDISVGARGRDIYRKNDDA